jgi:hypothetical protein
MYLNCSTLGPMTAEQLITFRDQVFKSKWTGMDKDYDVSELFHTWANDKAEQLITFRDQVFKSKWTGMTGSKMDQTFMQCLEDPLNHF